MPRKKSIRAKFLIMFTLSSIIPIIVLGVFSYRIAAQLIEEQIRSSASLSLSKVAAQLNIILLQVRQYARNVVSDTNVLDMIPRGGEPSSYALSRDAVSNKLDALAEPVSIPMKGLIITRTGWYDNYNYYQSEMVRAVDQIRDEDWYRQNPIYDNSLRYLGFRRSYVADFETEYQHYFVQNIHDSDGMILGILLIEINDYVIDRLLGSIQNNDYESVFMVDDRFNIVASSSGFNRSYSLNDLRDFAELGQSVETSAGDRRSQIIFLSENVDFAWRIIHITDRRSLLGSARRILALTAAILAFLIVTEILLFVLIDRTITRPIIGLSKTMETAQNGVFPVEFEERPGGEIGVLASGYNRMISEIVNLVDRIREEEAQLKQYEITSLQNQIMPHFLSNALNSIRLMADIAECPNISQAIVSLVNMLQYSIGNLEMTTTLDREISYVSSYVKLSNIRFNNKFRFCSTIPEAFGKIEIAKFLLQPLVENSIIHGLVDKPGVGNIILSAKEDGDQLLITLSDDGLGMSPERKLHVEDSIEKCDEANISHIGLYNVTRRIKLLYGTHHSISIETQVGKGTQVTIPIHTRCPTV